MIIKILKLLLPKIRDEDIIKTLIKRFIPEGNNIVWDGWASYNWLDEENSGYSHFKYIHGSHDFRFGFESTSHVENLWSVLKAEIISIYKSIPSKNFLFFLKRSRMEDQNKK